MEIESIETKRLIIRPLNRKDCTSIFRLSQEKSLRDWIPDQVYESEAKAQEVLEYLVSQYQDFSSPKERPLVLAVVEKSTGEVIGHVGLSPLKGSVEIGYAIGERRQGTGLGSEVVKATSSWALENFPVETIIGVVETANKASCRVLEKAGYTLNSQRKKMHQGRERMCRIYAFESIDR